MKQCSVCSGIRETCSAWRKLSEACRAPDGQRCIVPSRDYPEFCSYKVDEVSDNIFVRGSWSRNNFQLRLFNVSSSLNEMNWAGSNRFQSQRHGSA